MAFSTTSNVTVGLATPLDETSILAPAATVRAKEEQMPSDATAPRLFPTNPPTGNEERKAPVEEPARPKGKRPRGLEMRPK